MFLYFVDNKMVLSSHTQNIGVENSVNVFVPNDEFEKGYEYNLVNGQVVKGNQVVKDEQEILRMEEEYNSIIYQQQRASEYPPIGDQLDALWKGGDAAEEMLARVQAVKTKYPKPE